MSTASVNPIIHVNYISRDEEISGGVPIIAGTRIRVSQIALEYERLGCTPDQIIDAHPHLTLAQVHAALAYYYENVEQFREELAGSEELINSLRLKYPRKTGAVDASEEDFLNHIEFL